MHCTWKPDHSIFILIVYVVQYFLYKIFTFVYKFALIKSLPFLIESYVYLCFDKIVFFSNGFLVYVLHTKLYTYIMFKMEIINIYKFIILYDLSFEIQILISSVFCNCVAQNEAYLAYHNSFSLYNHTTASQILLNISKKIFIKGNCVIDNVHHFSQ